MQNFAWLQRLILTMDNISQSYGCNPRNPKGCIVQSQSLLREVRVNCVFAVRHFCFAVGLFVFAVRLFVLPWAFCFCRETFCFAVTVVGHRISGLKTQAKPRVFKPDNT